jgi:predicted MPP superfamily phosphohydrolase
MEGLDQNHAVEGLAVDHLASLELTVLERKPTGSPIARSESNGPTLMIGDEEDEDLPLVGNCDDTQMRLHQRRPSKSLSQRTLKNVCLVSAGMAILSLVAISLILSDTDLFDTPGFPFHANDKNPPTLVFKERSGRKEFKIVQITDIHLGEAEYLDWGPEQDRKTWHVLDAVLSAEAPIDLIVLGGDQLTANNCENNATSYYHELGEFLSRYGVPWATIFGNHDDTAYQSPTGEITPAKFSRRDLLKVDQSFPLSATQAGPETIDGTSNYLLDVYDTSESTVAAQVLLLDSGGGAIPSIVSDSQIAWVREQISRSTVPAIAFQHIPTEAHRFIDDGRCQGLHADGFDPVDYDGGIMETLSATGRFFFLGVGHDHGMGYCCPYGPADQMNTTAGDDANKMHVCFGRHSGYGGYGRWERGCRVYELHYVEGAMLNSEAKNPAIQWSSWVRLESGEIVDRLIH